MLMHRVIPALLLRNRGLVKTIRFKDPVYVGDPINAIRIFNEKEVDELVLLNMTATRDGERPPFKLIGEIASECFMPLGYGGGIRSLEDIRELFALGVEKVLINSFSVEEPEFIRRAADAFGSQSIVVSIDARKRMFGRYEVCTHGGTRKTSIDPVAHAQNVAKMGAGEILLTSIDRDGTLEGYDVDLIKRVTSMVDVPVIACGGAGHLNHFRMAIVDGGASAVSAGSFFVFHGKHRAVLISYPSIKDLERFVD